MIHFKFVGIKDMHNIYYLGLSGERSLPFGLLVDLVMSWLKLFLFFGASSAGDEFNSDSLWITTLSMQLNSIVCRPL